MGKPRPQERRTRVVAYAAAARQADRIERGAMFMEMQAGRVAPGLSFDCMIRDAGGKNRTAALQTSRDGKFVFLKAFRRAQPTDLTGDRWQKVG